MAWRLCVCPLQAVSVSIYSQTTELGLACDHKSLTQNATAKAGDSPIRGSEGAILLHAQALRVACTGRCSESVCVCESLPALFTQTYLRKRRYRLFYEVGGLHRCTMTRRMRVQPEPTQHLARGTRLSVCRPLSVGGAFYRMLCPSHALS